MQASETKVRQLIEGTKQYVVPLFQRPYSWSEKHWKTLWADVVDQSKHEDGRPHFFGSIVTTPARSVPQGVGKFLLIDGQQRLTTVQLFLAAIRDCAIELGENRLRERIDGQYLANAYEEGDERLKVLPTQEDRPAFRAILGHELVPQGRMRACYDYFQTRLGRLPADRLDAIHLALVDRLSLVSITCDGDDNPQLIFESLNAKGEKLTPADLIRNFLLMRVHVGDQEKLFKAHWLPIQQALDSVLTEFVRHYLMKEGKILREADVYFELKDRLANSSPSQAEAFLKELHRHGMYYAKFIGTIPEPDKGLAENLDRIRRLKVTVAYPFLLRVFDAHESGKFTRSQVQEVLDLLESFVIRRSICGIPTNQLRRMLPPVFDAAGGATSTFVDGLRKQLGGTRCPDDTAFVNALLTKPLYLSAEQNARLRLVLERLERSFGHKEPADFSAATIEHVLPQSLTDAWERELGDRATEHWAKLVHTLGNLTVSAYNPELSNQPYQVKRKLLVESHFVLNRYFANVTNWNAESIADRGQKLAQQAVKIWPDVGRVAATTELVKRAKKPSLAPVSIRFRDVVQPVVSWKDAYLKLVEQFESNNPGLLVRLAAEQAFDTFVAPSADRFLRSKAQIGGVFVNTHASAKTFQLWCRRIGEAGGFGPGEFQFVMSDGTTK